MDCRGGVYKILNLVNGKMYIGSSINLNIRKLNYINELKRKDHKNQHLQNAWNKYGEKSFEFIILEYVTDNSIILQREQYWIDFYKSYDVSIGYNICSIAGNTLGVICSEEKKLKIGNANRGERNGSAILTIEQVKEIKTMIMNGVKSPEISKNYNVKPSTILNIKDGSLWKYVEVNGISADDLRKKNNNLGSDKCNARFTRKDILDIRSMIANGDRTKDIALIYNCLPSLISAIKTGRTYSSITSFEKMVV